MPSIPGRSPSRQQIVTGAILSGGINAVIRAFLLRGTASVPLSVDRIGAGTRAVPGAAAPQAGSPAMILTALAHWTMKAPTKTIVPPTLWRIVKQGLCALGAVVAGAIVWQRAFGTVEVGLWAAVILLGLIAGVGSAAVTCRTIPEVVGNRP
jgi:hypothetical protein